MDMQFLRWDILALGDDPKNLKTSTWNIFYTPLVLLVAMGGLEPPTSAL
jgi:hypothetical protein